MYTIQNEFLKVNFQAKGAELTSIVNLKDQTEYLWQADPNHWGKHAPILFPIVGGLKNGQYQLKGQTYELSRHGFARDLPFDLFEQTATSITFVLKSDENTFERYPFEFALYVKYTLHENQLVVNYRVYNLSDDTMYYGIGGHPAFNVPLVPDLEFTDYQLSFTQGKVERLIPLEDNLLNLEKAVENPEVSQIPLTHDLFKGDALVYTTTTDPIEIVLSSTKDSHKITVNYQDLPFVGIWSTYPVASPFVCIEPWASVADITTTSGDLTEKYGIESLSIGDQKEYQYTIRFE